MARLRYHRPSPPPPAPPAPAPPSTLLAAFDLVLQVGLVVLVVVGVVAVVRWVDGLSRPPAGWVCWQVARVTAEDTQRDRTCEPAAGWHVEEWPGHGRVAVPDDAKVVRRYPVRD
jgi:hypothetical protein